MLLKPLKTFVLMQIIKWNFKTFDVTYLCCSIIYSTLVFYSESIEIPQPRTIFHPLSSLISHPRRTFFSLILCSSSRLPSTHWYVLLYETKSTFFIKFKFALFIIIIIIIIIPNALTYSSLPGGQYYLNSLKDKR